MAQRRSRTLPFQTSAEFRAEHIATFYGINPLSHEVETVTLSRGMILTRYRGDKYPTPYKIRNGRPPEGQVARVFGLTDIIRVDLVDAAAERAEPSTLTDLKALAAQRRATHHG